MKSLYKRTLTLLKNDPRPVTQIAKESGLPYEWLFALKRERFKNPSVNRIQKLYEFLSGKKILLK